MIAIFSNIVKILSTSARALIRLSARSSYVMLSSRTYTLFSVSVPLQFPRENCVVYLLRIHRSLQLCHIICLAYCPQENGLELVHTSISEQQGWIIVGDHGGRRHCRSPMLAQ
jgi:hypothetical protein